MVRVREMADDEDTSREVVELFLAGATEGLRDLRRSEGAGDAAGALRAAHKLKGSARNVGAEALATLAERVEERGRSGHVDGMAGLVEDAEAHLGLLRDALAEMSGDAPAHGENARK